MLLQKNRRVEEWMNKQTLFYRTAKGLIRVANMTALSLQEHENIFSTMQHILKHL